MSMIRDYFSILTYYRSETVNVVIRV